MLSSISAALTDLIRKLGLREYSWLYLILIGIANLYVAFNYRNEVDHIVFDTRFYARADYYDSGRRIIDEIQDSPREEGVLYCTSLSYRNEDLYVFEIRAGLSDSTYASRFLAKLNERILGDHDIQSRFTNRYEMIQRDLSYLNSSLDTIPERSLLYFQMKSNLSQLLSDRDELLRRFNPLPLQTYRLSPYSTDHSRDYWIASFLAFCLAFLIRAFVANRT